MAKSSYCDIGNKENRQKVLEKYNGHCAYCGCVLTSPNFTIDHIIPARRKMDNCEHGSHSIDNYNPACKSCNFSKSSMDLEKWRVELSKKLDRLKRDSSTYRMAIRFNMIEENTSPIIFYFETI